jgi:hypothetical protein
MNRGNSESGGQSAAVFHRLLQQKPLGGRPRVDQFLPFPTKRVSSKWTRVPVVSSCICGRIPTAICTSSNSWISPQAPMPLHCRIGWSNSLQAVRLLVRASRRCLEHTLVIARSIRRIPAKVIVITGDQS